MGAADEKRRGFFQFLFGTSSGYLRVGHVNREKGGFFERFFSYPDALDEALQDINKYSTTHDVYFTPHLFTEPTGQKPFVSEVPAIWADLDDCEPDKMLVEPTLVIESSRKRYQALWKLKEPINAVDGERIAKRIAYHHLDEGADKSGWDLTQLLRVPLTFNHKYAATGMPQPVKVIKATPELQYRVVDFDTYPELDEKSDEGDIPLPDKLPDKDMDEIVDYYRVHMSPRVIDLISNEPTTDWSKALWELELSLFEAGMSLEEAFIVSKGAACNKYVRDGKPDTFLWKDLQRAYKFVQRRNDPVEAAKDSRAVKEIPLLSDEERKYIAERPDITSEYIEWGKTLGDAAWQYHQAGAFIVLSTLLAGAVKLPTSFGTVLPNLWFMILADTTLTRKSTAMDMAMDMVVEIDQDAVLATDGSIEGLLTSLSMRPGRPSVFLRDEFSGLLEMITKKDYYAGMAETLTKLYDGKYQKRVLRKETLEVKDPVLVLFAGGIKERVLSLLTPEHVTSGFIPRFVFITAESDVTRLRPIGPPTTQATGKRTELIQRLSEMRQHYWQPAGQTEAGKIALPKQWNAELTGDAWLRYNQAEKVMLEAGLRSPIKDQMTPTFDRLTKSGLKAAVLLAAAKNLGDKILVEEEDIVRALYYVEQWREHTLKVINNIGQTVYERSMGKVLKAIGENPGVTRSTLMQNFRLSARQAEEIFTTLEQRGLIRRQKQGRAERFEATQFV